MKLMLRQLQELQKNIKFIALGLARFCRFRGSVELLELRRRKLKEL
jgi:hypothetical protein